MGTITRNFANNLTTSGLLKPDAFNNDSFDNVTAVPSGSVETGDMVFIKKLTASSSATLSFVDGSNGVVLDDTYKEYVFTFNNMHPSANAYTQFQGTTDGTNYNTTITSTSFSAYHDEADSFAILSYNTGGDQAQGTGFQRLNETDSVGTDNDMSMSGTLRIFNPSSTTFVKHFLANNNSAAKHPLTSNVFVAGYFNTTNAITGIQFKQTTGNIDAGDICLYGIA